MSHSLAARALPVHPSFGLSECPNLSSWARKPQSPKSISKPTGDGSGPSLLYCNSVLKKSMFFWFRVLGFKGPEAPGKTLARHSSPLPSSAHVRVDFLELPARCQILHPKQCKTFHPQTPQCNTFGPPPPPPKKKKKKSVPVSDTISQEEIP